MYKKIISGIPVTRNLSLNNYILNTIYEKNEPLFAPLQAYSQIPQISPSEKEAFTYKATNDILKKILNCHKKFQNQATKISQHNNASTLILKLFFDCVSEIHNLEEKLKKINTSNSIIAHRIYTNVEKLYHNHKDELANIIKKLNRYINLHILQSEHTLGIHTIIDKYYDLLKDKIFFTREATLKLLKQLPSRANLNINYLAHLENFINCFDLDQTEIRINDLLQLLNESTNTIQLKTAQKTDIPEHLFVHIKHICQQLYQVSMILKELQKKNIQSIHPSALKKLFNHSFPNIKMPPLKLPSDPSKIFILTFEKLYSKKQQDYTETKLIELMRKFIDKKDITDLDLHLYFIEIEDYLIQKDEHVIGFQQKLLNQKNAIVDLTLELLNKHNDKLSEENKYTLLDLIRRKDDSKDSLNKLERNQLITLLDRTCYLHLLNNLLSPDTKSFLKNSSIFLNEVSRFNSDLSFKKCLLDLKIQCSKLETAIQKKNKKVKKAKKEKLYNEIAEYKKKLFLLLEQLSQTELFLRQLNTIDIDYMQQIIKLQQQKKLAKLITPLVKQYITQKKEKTKQVQIQKITRLLNPVVGHYIKHKHQYKLVQLLNPIAKKYIKRKNQHKLAQLLNPIAKKYISKKINCTVKIQSKFRQLKSIERKNTLKKERIKDQFLKGDKLQLKSFNELNILFEDLFGHNLSIIKKHLEQIVMDGHTIIFQGSAFFPASKEKTTLAANDIDILILGEQGISENYSNQISSISIDQIRTKTYSYNYIFTNLKIDKFDLNFFLPFKEEYHHKSVGRLCGNNNWIVLNMKDSTYQLHKTRAYNYETKMDAIFNTHITSSFVINKILEDRITGHLAKLTPAEKQKCIKENMHYFQQLARDITAEISRSGKDKRKIESLNQEALKVRSVLNILHRQTYYNQGQDIK